MSASNRPSTGGERLVGPLVLTSTPLPGRPPPVPVPVPVPAPMPALPPLRLPAGAGVDDLVLDMARLDRSGRLHAHRLMDALGWHPGHRVDVAAVAGLLVVGSAAAGLYTVGGRGELGLPAAARRMCGIELGRPVVLVAAVSQQVLVVHPDATVVQLLAEYHARLERGP